MINTSQDRMEWVDVLKFLGIWAIYLGHFGNKSGLAYPFVFTYDVPMFFFAAGFFATRYLKYTPLVFIKKKTLQLIVSYIFFGLIALVIFSLEESWNILQLRDAVIALALGIRNHIFAGSLWFLPCLYWIVLLDYFIIKTFKLRIVSIAIAVGIFVITQTIFSGIPNTPSWFMNMDSALFYYIYYVLGTILFPYLIKKPVSLPNQIIVGVSVAIAFAVTSLVYFLGSGWVFGKITTLAPMLSKSNLMHTIIDVLITLTIIYFNIFLAKLLAGIRFLGALGRETLIFCGTEDIMKIIFTQVLVLFNLKANLNTPFRTIAFALICLIVSYFTIVKFLNAYFPQFIGKITKRAIANP